MTNRPDKRELVGIVLAAGAGRRMGAPKALLTDRGGVPLGQRHAQRLLACGCRQVLLLVPPGRARLALRQECLSESEAGRIRVIEADTQGPAETLSRARAALARFDACFVTPVDLAPVAINTARRLLAHLREGALAVTPSYRGQGGHPVLLTASALPMPPEEEQARPLRDTLRALGRARRRVEVDDPNVLSDWDFPAELSWQFRLPAGTTCDRPAPR